MGKAVRRGAACLLALGMALASFAVCEAAARAAEVLPTAMRCRVCTADGTEAETLAQTAREGCYLFLPSCADLTRLTLLFDGTRRVTLRGAAEAEANVASGDCFDLTALFPQGPNAEGEYPLTVDGAEGALTVMQSANQAALWITSDNPKTRGRAYVDSSPTGGGKLTVTGEMLMLDANGETVYDGGLRELRGRGNTTWDWSAKKPYQIKLEEKTDLLENGANNRARTWLLLAEAFDCTLLHNTISLSLGKELGLRGTPEARPVDVYYDGEYRGYYLLCEKVQVNPARLDVMDYSELLEQRYPRIASREAFPAQRDQNSYGLEYQYVTGLGDGLGKKGAYLLEMDCYKYSGETSWFFAAEGLPFVFKSPEYAPKADVEYVSRLMCELVRAVENGGVNPDTGKAAADYLDFDSMARYLLVNEFAKTCDFGYTSTYFYLPQDGERFYAGPLWDFDIAYGIRDDRAHEAGVENYVPGEGWIRALMTLPDFQAVMKQIFFEELEPLLSGVLLGDEEAKAASLCSLNAYLARTEASRRMNYKLWELGGGYNNINTRTLYDTFEENVRFFRQYLEERCDWLKRDMALWSGSEVAEIGLTLSYVNANVPATTAVAAANVFPHYDVAGVDYAQEPDAEVPYHRVYTAEIRLTARAGVSFAEGLTATVNGDAAEVMERTRESAVIRFRFTGPFYEEAVYDGVDYGLLYQYDYYVRHRPEAVEECGDDPEALLENYAVYDLYDGFSAIETFDYEKYSEHYYHLLYNYFAGDVGMSMLFYLDNDQPEPMLGLGEPIFPRGM